MPGRVLVAHAAVPRAARDGLVAGRGAEVGARADNPGKEQEAGDGADHDARDSAPRKRLGAVRVRVAVFAVVVGAGHDRDATAVRVGLGLALA